MHSITRLGGEGGSASGRGIDRSEIVYGSAPTEVCMRTGDESGGMHAGIVADFFERIAVSEEFWFDWSIAKLVSA